MFRRLGSWCSSVRSTLLSASFWEGFGSLLDIFPFRTTLGSGRNPGAVPRDWEAIERDYQAAIDEFRAENLVAAARIREHRKKRAGSE